MCSKYIVERREYDHKAKYKNAVVHGGRRDRRLSRPKAKEENDEHVADSEDVDGDSSQTRDSPRTPGELHVVLDVGRGWEEIVRLGNASGAASPQQQDGADEIREVERADR